jgi:hypothetical protein
MTQEESSELESMFDERQRRLEEAIERAELGQGTSEDFDIIRFECGLKSPSPSQEISDAIDAHFGDVFKNLNNLSIRKK